MRAWSRRLAKCDRPSGGAVATLSKRRVIRMSAECYVVTLPVDWWRYYGIEPGDILDVVTRDGELVVKVPESRLAQTRETVAEGA